jgi:type I restriction-modification system DNA methylase subunit
MPTTFDEAFAAVQSLAKNFGDHKGHYLSPTYKEAEVRIAFIDKFLMALGWDVRQDTQKTPGAQEVKVEPDASAGGSEGRADYAFYIAPHFQKDDVRFFVEAKKPAGEIGTPANCFQTLGYGFSAQTPLAVLTDFEQFYILDCRYKPAKHTATAQILRKYHYTDYFDREKFAEIFNLFSRAAVAADALTNFAGTLPKKRGYLSLNDAFLADLDQYRETLARAFKNRDPDLDGATLTEITQRTLDRLVFMRFLEDKQIHSENPVANFGTKGTAWQDFVAASRKLDGIYNGIVFKAHPRLDVPGFKVDDAAFSGICAELAPANTAYNFNYISIQILGSIYERFLGKVIVTTDKRARVEEKPEVRKAGGVYYTPEYIVRYIVENTVGKLIEDKTPAQIAELRFADIACGSGSFLLGVFDLLLRYHRDWFNTNPDKAQKAGCVQREDGAWHLSLKQRREILLHNIYGVDIDHQAVEVAQLSLYLKLLEEETTGTAREYQMEFHETLLPSLSKNIVCGNSLIGTDILTGQLFTGDEERKLNPMDFEDRFPEIMRRGGFDAIVGNPPYIFTRNEGLTPNEKTYFYKHYQHQSAQLNTFGLFLEKSQRVLRKGASLGYITPNNWLTIDSFAPLRQFVLEETCGLTVINILDRVFEAADVDTAIVLIQKGKPSKVKLCEMKDRLVTFEREVGIEAFKPDKFIMQISLVKDERAQKLLEIIEAASLPLSGFCTVSTGLKAYQTGKGKPPQTDKEKERRVFHASKQRNKSHGRYLDGVDVCRYNLSWSGEWLSYGDWLAEPRKSVPYSGERILVRQIPACPPHLVHGVFTDQPFYNDINSMVIFGAQDGISLKYLLALVNSRLISFWFQKTFDKLQRKIFPQFKVNELARFPIRKIDFDKSADRTQHDRMVALVEQMLAAKKQLAAAQSDADQDFYGNKCAGLDRQIDALVYEIYALTPDEIRIVEGATAWELQHPARAADLKRRKQ